MADIPQELASLRGSIDNLDAVLIHVLAERFKLTERVGRLKAEHELPAADPAREARQVDRLRALAEEANLDPEFAETFLAFTVAEVIRHHERIADEARGESDGDSAEGGRSR
ncbi:MAG: chorismate mutase [Brevibacterium yomogidense]|uniref:chorismate mutase n=1 Tax=Brevibacterium sp. Mu109 TaxID=1255669 RepID=UPI000C46786F|nr:chorismate mutase [Brevibacterium sp. Mu109]SMX84873.1 chorismate mutase [Brevibacterium sp. Mu109]